MTLAGATFVVIGFAVLIHVFRLVPNSQEVVTRSRGAVEIIRDESLDDEAKEIAIRKHAFRMFALSALLLSGGAGALLIPIGAVWLVGLTGWISAPDVVEMLQRWDFLAAATVVGIAAFYLVGRVRG